MLKLEKVDVRKHARVPIHAKAFITFGGSTQIASVLDVCSGGVAVKIPTRIPLGTQCEVLVKREQVTAAFVAQVLRQTPNGVVLQIRSQTYPNPLSKIVLAL